MQGDQMKIEIKNTMVLSALLSKRYDPTLVKITEYLPEIVGEKGFVITEGWRPGGGVHSAEPCRGIDIRSWIYTPAKLEEIETKINSRFLYDPERIEMQCCIIHDVGKGQHIHLQVHPNTKMVQDGV